MIGDEQVFALYTQIGLGSFPINRRHQGLATTTVMEAPIDRVVFPINMRRQRMATLKDLALARREASF